MNLSYLKYAVEVEKTGSITKAAQNFYMNQPHLSKIIRELEQQSQNVFRLHEGTLYPVLHALEQQGAVSTSRQLADNGRIRKYYAVTAHGRKLLVEKEKEWRVYETAVNQVMGGVLFG